MRGEGGGEGELVRTLSCLQICTYQVPGYKLDENTSNIHRISMFSSLLTATWHNFYLQKFCKHWSSLLSELHGRLSSHKVANKFAVDVHQLTLGKLQGKIHRYRCLSCFNFSLHSNFVFHIGRR